MLKDELKWRLTMLQAGQLGFGPLVNTRAYQRDPGEAENRQTGNGLKRSDMSDADVGEIKEHGCRGPDGEVGGGKQQSTPGLVRSTFTVDRPV